MIWCDYRQTRLLDYVPLAVVIPPALTIAVEGIVFPEFVIVCVYPADPSLGDRQQTCETRKLVDVNRATQRCRGTSRGVDDGVVLGVNNPGQLLVALALVLKQAAM